MKSGVVSMRVIQRKTLEAVEPNQAARRRLQVAVLVEIQSLQIPALSDRLDRAIR
jgi:hypothetical protein